MRIFLWIGLLISGAWAQENAYDVLRRIPSFSELIQQKNLKTYRVEVQAHGTLWDEMLQVARAQNVERPRLVEYGRFPLDFYLRMEGKGASADLLPGLFDPNAVFRVLAEDLEAIREEKSFLYLQRFSKSSLFEEGTLWHVHLEPREGEYIFRRFHDTGSEGERMEIRWLDVRVSRETGLLQEMQLEKRTRRDAMMSKGSQDIRSLIKLQFSYAPDGKRFLPKEVTLWRNGAFELRLAVEYKTVGAWKLPAKKIFEYAWKGSRESVTLEYGAYRLNENDLPREPGEEEMRLQKANQIAQEAQAAFMKGRIEEAKRRLKILSDFYPQTPQAKQAKIFLQGLP